MLTKYLILCSIVIVGVQQRIRHENQFALYINCRNHRLALCMTHLIKRFPLLQDVDSLLLSLWKLFEFSPQKTAVFKHIQMVYGKEQLTVVRAATTRWLSHLQASARFISRYVCIVDTLDSIYSDKKEPEVYGIRLAATDKKTVATILLLCDILKPVNILSLYLQQENINFTSLPVNVKATTDALTMLIETYEQYFNNLDNSPTEFSKCSELLSEIRDRTDLARRLRLGEQDAELTPESFLTKTEIPLIYILIQEIQDAFCTGEPVLKSFGYLDPSNLPDTVQELNEIDYGKVDIERMVAFYGQGKEDTFRGHRVVQPALMDPVLLRTQLKDFRMQLFMMNAAVSTM